MRAAIAVSACTPHATMASPPTRTRVCVRTRAHVCTGQRHSLAQRSRHAAARAQADHLATALRWVGASAAPALVTEANAQRYSLGLPCCSYWVPISWDFFCGQKIAVRMAHLVQAAVHCETIPEELTCCCCGRPNPRIPFTLWKSGELHTVMPPGDRVRVTNKTTLCRKIRIRISYQI